MTWTSLTEVTLRDAYGKSAGNIDVVLVAYDQRGHIIDYGALEVQAVYISGNVRTAFQHYMEDPADRYDMDWRRERNYPRPDFLSSSRKRLAPQLIFKGGILNAWSRKIAVALDSGLYQTLPTLDEVEKADADMAWLIYDLRLDKDQNRYKMEQHKTVYTRFEPALIKITRSEAGKESDFMARLQANLNRKLDGGIAPDATTTTDSPF